MPRRLLCLPIDIPSKYMPLAMLALIFLMSGFQLHYALSTLLGYGFAFGYLDRLKPSSYFFESLESGVLSGLSRQRGYVLAASSLGHESWIPTNLTSVQRDGPMAVGGSSGNSAGGGASAAGAGGGFMNRMFRGSGQTAAAGGYELLPQSSSHGPDAEPKDMVR